MPTVTEGIVTGFSNLTTNKQNIVDAIDAVDRREIPFLAMLGWAMEADITKAVDSLKFPCIQAQHTWQSDSLVPSTAIITTNAHVSGSGTVKIGSGEAKYFVQDEVMVATSGNTTVHFRLTAIDTANDVLSVEIVSGSADAALPVGTTLYSMSRPALRGETYAFAGKATTLVSDTNFCQIFGAGKEGVISVDGTEQSTESWGIDSQLDYQTAKRLAELAIKLEQASLYGLRNTTYPTQNAQPAAMMGGLWYFMQTLSGGLSQNALGAQLSASENYLRTLMDQIWGEGGNPSVLMMNVFNRSQMSDLLTPYVRTDRGDRGVGVVVDEYTYSHGTVAVALNKWVHPQHVWLLSPEAIGIGPLTGNGNSRAFATEDLPKTGDFVQRAVIGEYTMEVHNRQQAHGLIKNLATS